MGGTGGRVAAGCCLALWLYGTAWAASLYRGEPDSTTIGFSVSLMGLFGTGGRFTRFDGSLVLDLDHPEASKVDVTVDTRSLSMPWPTAEETAQSTDYFDVVKYPEMRFVSRRVIAIDATHARIDGELTIRGTTRPQSFTADLEGRRFDPGLNAEVADFVVRGTVDRRDFGMQADSSFVSNEVTIRIKSHIRLAEASPNPGWTARPEPGHGGA